MYLAEAQETQVGAAEDSLETPDPKTQAGSREYSGVQGPQAECEASTGCSVDAPAQEGDGSKQLSTWFEKEDMSTSLLVHLVPCVSDVSAIDELSEVQNQRLGSLPIKRAVLPVLLAPSGLLMPHGSSAHQHAAFTVDTPPREASATMGKSSSL